MSAAISSPLVVETASPGVDADGDDAIRNTARAIYRAAMEMFGPEASRRVFEDMETELMLLDDSDDDEPTAPLRPVVVDPTSATAVANLRRVKFEDGARSSSAEGCAICLQDYKEGDELTEMPCSGGHRFHRQCILEWLARRRSCPLCRHLLPGQERDTPMLL
ncbi:E3 ubiquitin-protein ligase RNF181 [Brachypodium distachyon]|uniref:RING-type domain-containing protein n=1 Tax=Brachypodium distachyon TaxID=15368 RepID=I1I6D3_BRADI|nr:E3 ubiquitin-protein ligase RNF181 [Brachypodium distachyon]PNT67941.1 hypothetical protein BRADI_3g34010v3 [Brachypodium distachyon]|eukprot:XP_010235021.1 E3 ubiquitin-protein ligase RNF181 [Brachypodium distachyon]